MSDFREFLKDEWPFPHLLLGVALVCLITLALAAWPANTPEQEPECQKPILQLSEILK